MTRKNTGSASAAAVPLLFLAFVAVGIAAGARDREGADSTARVVAAVEPIAHRVERIRGVRFRRVPRPEVVTADETRRVVLSKLDREYPKAQRERDAELLELLGLIPAGTDLREVVGDVSGEQVAGYYDPKRKRLAVVSGADAGSGPIAEIILAHELTHALEDQRFGIDDDPPESGADDAATAYNALVEGTATDVMDSYIERYIPPGAALASAFSAVGASGGSEGIPPYIQRSLEFSYTGGQRFVSALRDVGGGWRLVNVALRKRPPVSSEQILHPGKYIPFEAPLPVRIAPLGLGRDWKRSDRGTIGELDTRELFRLGRDEQVAERAAAGWGGGRYELWRSKAAAAGCDADPCRRAAVLVLRWRWDTPLDAREFRAALPLYVEAGLDGVAAGGARWRIGDGGAAISASGDAVTLVLGPSPGEAARVAASAGRAR